MKNIGEADPELLEMLKDGDGRTSPSALVETKFQSTEVLHLEDESRTKEDIIKDEVEGNLRKVIEYGNGAISDLADLASSSEHPRPYEALSALIKSVVDANTALLDVRKTPTSILKNKRTTDETEVETKEDIMKASVGDLLDMIDRHKRKNDKTTIDIEPEKHEDS